MKVFNSIKELLDEINLTRKMVSPYFYIFRYDELDYEKRIENFPHYKRFFEISFYEENENKTQIGHTVLKDLNNAITFTSPMQSLSINRIKRPVGYVMFFNAKFFTPERHQYNIQQDFPFFKLNTTPVYKISQEEKLYIKNILENIHKESLENKSQCKEIIQSYLLILLNYITRILKGDSGNVKLKRYEEITSNFEEMILQEDESYKSIVSYAKLLGITPLYLSECVKKTTGLSAKKVLTNYQILKAKSLLVQTTNSIDEIAHVMGFKETTNFIKFFKKDQQITPLAYRKLP
ncbi:helix-turn-helix domain-containing protein [Wenyingzhuangia sp. chi5]|uniref:Helix-turn-helix domain-containing protein n=1 Tax=Wenyingzhuangia gilva TaxID=3057677 RepID=A0ABT8VSC5_9FLAO|nr:helix-turn-helix domain-containing protein [Wenyingzhuangia sp. chi5]MDO3694868.1 helix-turn-helix domain-containing protein [Wenyingzhuangia sp. chi5]